MDTIKQVDIRSRVGRHQGGEAAMGQAPAVMTLPLAFRNVAQPSKRATIDRSTARLTVGAVSFDFEWDKFVEMHEENFGKWLGIVGDAHPLTVDPGSVEFREVLYRPLNKATWAEIVRLFSDRTADEAVVTVVAYGTQELRETCRVDMKYWANQVEEFVRKANTAPGRVTMNCVQSSNGTEVR